MDEFDECSDECAVHAENCDGYCDHTGQHENGCILYPYIGL